MNANESHRRRIFRALSSLASITIAKIETKLRVVLSCRHKFVRMHIHTRSNTQLHARCWQALSMQRIQTIEFVKIVYNDVSNPCLNCGSQFFVTLVIAMHHTVTCRNTSIERHKQLATCSNVEQQTFFVRKARHCSAQKCLRCVHHSFTTKSCNRFATTRTQMFFVVYKHRGAKLGSNIGKQTSTDAQLAISPYGSVVGQ